MSKIDTQGMSGPSVPGGKDNIYPHDENGNPILPRMMVKPDRLLTPMMVNELKILINEVLDEREYKAKLEGPYDNPEPPPQSYFDLKDKEYTVE